MEIVVLNKADFLKKYLLLIKLQKFMELEQKHFMKLYMKFH